MSCCSDEAGEEDPHAITTNGMATITCKQINRLIMLYSKSELSLSNTPRACIENILA